MSLLITIVIGKVKTDDGFVDCIVCFLKDYVGFSCTSGQEEGDCSTATCVPFIRCCSLGYAFSHCLNCRNFVFSVLQDC